MDSVLSWRSCVPVSDWQLLADVRVPQVFQQDGHQRPAHEGLQALSQPFQVVSQIQLQQIRDRAVHVQWPRTDALLFRRTTVVVYLYSGRRREGDFMSHAQAFGSTLGLNVKVLLVDLALSEHHDMLDVRKYLWLCARVKSGEVAAILAAPPCETWSRARARQLLDGSSGPRVLRTPESPWCKIGLQARELQQLDVANRLMYVTLKLHVISLLHHVLFIMEHPADPEDQTLVSIWRTWPVQWLLQHPAAQLHRLYQSSYGSAYHKPTNFMTLWLPHFGADMQVHVSPTPSRALIGRDVDGFVTRYAKEYPPKLNQSLAYALLFEVQRQWAVTPPSQDISAEFSDFVQSLDEVQRPTAEQQMQPDYARTRT